jgi:hypothetical protein
MKVYINSQKIEWPHFRRSSNFERTGTRSVHCNEAIGFTGTGHPSVSCYFLRSYKMMTPSRCFNGAVSTALILLLLSLVVTDAVTPVRSKHRGTTRSSSEKSHTRKLQSGIVDLQTTTQSHNGKGKSKKSQAPSEAPSISAAPTNSLSPSSAPTRSPAPSAPPSPSPTGTPTRNPTQAPTTLPTLNPTQSPTSSISPTPLPFDTVSRVDSTGDVERKSLCTRAVPSTATVAADVVLNFDYNMFVTEAAEDVAVDVALSMSTVETRLHPMLAGHFLDCQFDGDTPFEVRSISSFPVDQVYQNCAAEDQVFDSDCWIIDAGITVEIFYLNDRRFLQADSDVISSFGDFLNATFGDGGLIEIGDAIIALRFVGFTNGVREETFTNEDDDTDTGATVAGIGNGPQPADDGTTTVIWSSILVGAAAMCLVVVALMAVRRRKGGKDSKELGDMVVLQDDFSDDGTGSSYYTGSLSRGRQGRNDREQHADKVLVLSDNMDAYDDNRTSGGYDIDPQWSPRAFGEDNFNPPTFVATDATDHNRKMSLKSLRSPPRGYASRAYVSSDTVDL